jgi:hypothetical protein
VRTRYKATQETKVASPARPERTLAKRSGEDIPRSLGNQAIARLFRVSSTELADESLVDALPSFAHQPSPRTNDTTHFLRIQPKLIVGNARSTSELEADRIGEQVMRTPERQPNLAGEHDTGSPDYSSTHTPREPIQTKRASPSEIGDMTAQPIVHDVLRSSAQPLDSSTRGFMESRFGHDFTSVRVHSDGEAAEAARAVQAQAYTVGSNIVFGSGQYAPATAQGKKLLAHELMHVVQQRRSPNPELVNRRIIPTDVSSELVGQNFLLRKDFTDGAVKMAAGQMVTVTSWSDTSDIAEVFSRSQRMTFNVPKHLLKPLQPGASGVAPYGVGLVKVEQEAENAAAKVEAFKKTEAKYTTDKGKQFFAKELQGFQAEQTRIGAKLNIKLIQATMLNRFDVSIKKWVDFYNTQFGFTGKDALDPNLIKAVMYEESAMGTDISFMNTSTISVIQNRFNLIQAIDSWPEEQLLVIVEKMPALITKYHLENIGKDLIKAQVELENLAKKEKAGRTTAAENTRLAQLSAQSEPLGNWIPWYRAYPGLEAAIVEFLRIVEGGKAHSEDYDFWIRVGVRAVFDKHEKNKPVTSWAEAARAYNGKGPPARKYRDRVLERAEQAVKAEKAGKEFVPKNL